MLEIKNKIIVELLGELFWTESFKNGGKWLAH